jgi:hypothetical protein
LEWPIEIISQTVNPLFQIVEHGGGKSSYKGISVRDMEKS